MTPRLAQGGECLCCRSVHILVVESMAAGHIWSDGTTIWLTANETTQQGNPVGVLHAYDLDSGAAAPPGI